MVISLDSPLDMHLHLRDGDMLDIVAPLSAETFAAGLIMPNLVPPVTTKEAVCAYRERILEAQAGHRFLPYMTLFFKSDYSPEFLESVREEILAIKLYPAGITTNSEGGVSGFDLGELSPVLGAMSDLGIPLCVHGETGGFVMDREAEFIPVYEMLAQNFPDLTIVMEHITTKDAVEALDRYENLYATITLHHLYITLDDVAGGLLQPHLFCKPIAKRPEDRTALLNAALKAHPKVMFGSDSAPHPRDKKEAPGCAAGVFTAPIALQALAQLFDRHDALDNLQAFVSGNAQRIYGIVPPVKEVVLEKTPWLVPDIYEGTVVPMFAGQSLEWRIVSVG
ncbi:dihydroorotase [Hydrogenimonas sp.]|uniref:dihydroorotase n=1 Tax=Hydrogenimonas sp. TaxID=2231112 RepID=UPI002629F1C6|nr:dihydroorotase [Hydrogenimonas sp.]